jgi:hypothetical protein
MFIYILAIILVLPAICTRLIFLSPIRVGAINYYSNVLSEFFVKRLGLPHGIVEAGLLFVGVLIMAFTEPLSWLDGIVALWLVTGLELYLRFQERRILDTVYAYPTNLHPYPSAHPEITVNLNGPFVTRLPRYDLGDIVAGRIIDLEMIIGNHSIVPSQVPTIVDVQGTHHLTVEPLFCREIRPLASGDVFRGIVRLTARGTDQRGRVRLRVTCGERTTILIVTYRSIFDRQDGRITGARIVRYAGASRSAFAWRGDMDQYDTSTFQSIDGLVTTLDLAARYRFPQTMYLSPRLTLVLGEAREFYHHFGVDRGQDQIPDFISWFRDHVELRHRMAYPFCVDKSYAMELGNHGFLHYGTDAAAAPGNGWRCGARIGDGNYDWLGADKHSFAEQRDNALAAARICEEYFHFTPKSWARPDMTNDAYTPAAMEAAGCQVLSDSDAAHRHNVLLQPPPHHPAGQRVVELTKRYPGDPQHIFHVSMIRYWIHRAHRKRIPVVFMCHQHMRQFDGYGCTRFTESILRYVLSRFHGDLHINTVYGIGIYWNEVLSSQNRTVYVESHDDTVVVRNTGQVDLSAVPLDISYQGGRRATVLIDLSPGSSFRVFGDGRVETL